MPVYPLVFEPIVKTGRYHHMARRDAVVWERWIDVHGRQYASVAYDVALGGVCSALPNITPKQQQGFQYLSALKIDALLNNAGQYTIVEVKPEANVSAIGAVLAYRHLLTEEYAAGPLSAMLLVCEFASVDIIKCASAMDITVQRV